MKSFSKFALLSLSIFSLAACVAKEQEVSLFRLTTPKVEKISTKNNYEISQTTYNSYLAFAKKFSKLAISETNKDKEESLGVSIPDAYLCMAITAIVSSDAARNDVLAYLELNTIEELRTAVKEILATLCTLYEDNYHKYHGGYNLNSIWLDPEQVELVKEKDTQLYKDLEEIFDASTYNEALTGQKANQYLKDNGLKDMPTPKIELNDQQPPAMAVMSVYYCLDYFQKETKEYYKQQYQSGTHKMDYTFGGKTSKVNYIEQTYNGDVYAGSGFYGADLNIQQLKMSYFLPNDKTAMPSTILDDVLDENYSLKQSQFTDWDEKVKDTTIHEVHVSAPYFSLNNSVSLERDQLSKILPVITQTGAGRRMVNPLPPNTDMYLEFLKQFSVMKFNYDGFYSCSVTIMGYGAESAIPVEYEKFELKLDHPYVFEVKKNVKVGKNYTSLPIIVGEIVNPDYQD